MCSWEPGFVKDSSVLSGIPFVRFALDIKNRSPLNPTLVVGNTNGYPGYVPTRKAFEHKGFEVWPARSGKVGPGGGEFTADRAIDMLNQLRGS